MVYIPHYNGQHPKPETFPVYRPSEGLEPIKGQIGRFLEVKLLSASKYVQYCREICMLLEFLGQVLSICRGAQTVHSTFYTVHTTVHVVFDGAQL